jgi:predicted SAM-dependent methyltransferase
MEKLKKIINNDGEIFWEYKEKQYPDYCNHGNAMKHIFPIAKEFCKGCGLDIGAGKYTFPGAIPIRNEILTNAYNLDSIDMVDYIFSSHCLEHLERPKEALKLWYSKLKPEGILFLYLPHPSMELWRMGGPWVKNAHKWIPEPKHIIEFFENLGLKIISGNGECDNYHSFHYAGKK